MRCEHVRERALESLLAGAEIPPGIEPHLTKCHECAAEVSRLRAGARAVQLLRDAAVDPPKEIKARVFEAIGADVSARMVRPQERVAVPWTRALLRPVPVAAAALITLCIVGTLSVVAQRSKVGETNRIVKAVRESGVVRVLNELESAPWVADAVGGTNAVKSAKLQLQRVAEAWNDPRTVFAARNAVTQQHLVETFRTLQHVAPADQAALVAQVRQQLEGIQALQP